VQHENTFPVGDAIEIDGIDSLYVARCVLDNVASSDFFILFCHSISFWHILQCIKTSRQHWRISWSRIFRIKAHNVLINCTEPPYWWTRFQTFTKADPEIMAFPDLTSRKTNFSDISGKPALFKFQDAW